MNNPTERPIAFLADEVRETLARSKTQHRVPFDFEFIKDVNVPIVQKVADETNCTLSELVTGAYKDGSVYDFDCPFGKVGDRLWVQEDWRVGAWREIGGVLAIDYKASPEITNTPWVQLTDDEDGKKFEDVWIAVTDELDSKGVKTNDDGHYHWPAGQAPLDWHGASTMPRWASRLLLEITNIRIERLNDISEQDAIAMGVQKLDDTGANKFTMIKGTYHCSRPTAAQIIKDIYKFSDNDDTYFKNGENPWVWVIEFKVVEPSEVQGA